MNGIPSASKPAQGEPSTSVAHLFQTIGVAPPGWSATTELSVAIHKSPELAGCSTTIPES